MAEKTAGFITFPKKGQRQEALDIGGEFGAYFGAGVGLAPGGWQWVKGKSKKARALGLIASLIGGTIGAGVGAAGTRALLAASINKDGKKK